LWGAVGGLAAAVGPSLGSFVVDSFGWPWAFYLNLPLGALSLWYGALILPKDHQIRQIAKVDSIGMVLLIAAASCIALSIVQSHAPNWSGAELWFVAASGGMAMLAFVVRARISQHPLIDLKLFDDPTYTFVNLATLLFGIAFSMMFFGYFFFLTNIWDYSLTRAGLGITPGPLCVVPVAIITGRLATRMGHRPFLVGGGLVHACSALWFLLVTDNEPAYLTHWLPGVVLGGIGVGMVLPSLSAAAVNNLPPHQYAVGSAVNQAIRQIGSLIGVALIVLLVGHPDPSIHDFNKAYILQAVFAISTALLCIPVDTRPRQYNPKRSFP
ncbi:MAG: MFS transporter, partial [Oxalobacteraceae bacterium]